MYGPRQSTSASDAPRMSDSDGARMATRLLSMIEAGTSRILLRSQQRLANPMISNQSTLALSRGVVAIEAIPIKGKRQILDFLLPGDVASPFTLTPAATVSLRAITDAALICLDDRQKAVSSQPLDYMELLLAQSRAEVARGNVHKLMIGHLDQESRVASFLLTLSLRSCSGPQREALLAIPMSREDIADYLVMNRDTLSRIMRRFETLAVIERKNRHAIRICDLARLKRLTPIAALLSTVFERQTPPASITYGRASAPPR